MAPANPPLPRWLERFAWVALAASAGLFVYIAARHVLYPGFTETMEGDALQHIARIAQGRPPYPSPGAEFIPLSYMPLFYYLAAPLHLLLGDTLAGPRLISALAALLAGGLIGWIVWRESGSRPLACLGAALYFSSYRLMDAYLVCALPDSLMLFWLLAGFCFFAYGTRPLHDALWLLLSILAFWTKQHAAFFFALAVLYALLFRRNHLPKWLIAGVMLAGGPLAYYLLGPWFGDGFFLHTFVVPGRWEHRAVFSVRRMALVLSCYVPFLLLLTSVYLVASTEWRRLRFTPLGWFVLSGLVATAVTMTAAGSSNNHYIPLIAALSATAALGIPPLIRGAVRWWLGGLLLGVTAVSAAVTIVALRSYAGHDISYVPPVATASALVLFAVLWRVAEPARGGALASVLLAGHLVIAFYYPARYLPVDGYSEALAALRAEIRALDGQVIWVPYGNVPAELTALKLPSSPSWVALEDVERQVNAAEEARRDLEPFLARIRGAPGLHILSDDRIEGVPVWRNLAPRLALVRDFGRQFSSVRQIAYHWYGGGNYPRYLYRVVPQAAAPSSPYAKQSQ